ncbi:hypothetical protein V496_03459 [Pseudogymnoascus sp. VKM F-4515 (FW-2607)]|nr:hypothetical protein V496_03459 [Pseudogymnoascus sp. VKM F-4515 (FW-2607)]
MVESTATVVERRETVVEERGTMDELVDRPGDSCGDRRQDRRQTPHWRRRGWMRGASEAAGVLGSAVEEAGEESHGMCAGGERAGWGGCGME